MERNGLTDSLKAKAQDGDKQLDENSLEWDWDIEHADRRREAQMDASFHGAGVNHGPFEVDRRVLKDVVREKMSVDVARIEFLSSGTFHKAYLITLVDKNQIVARVARRFMPRLKTKSEVATMQYLRQNTNIPVPTVYHHDSNPYNRLGGEFLIMSKAKGVPLAQVYHSLPYTDLVKLLMNVAKLLIPLFAHRFPALGSLYFGPDPRPNETSVMATPKADQHPYTGIPFSPTLGMTPIPPRSMTPNTNNFITPALRTPGPLSRMPSSFGSERVTSPSATNTDEFHVGPIISWPFFGSNRGELSHPTEVNRGPWSSTTAYFESCVDREVKGVVRENEGKSAPHKLHLDPDEIMSSRHHHLQAVPDDQSDDSDEWDLEESEDEWEGPGDAMYRDYRRMQRTTFLVSHLQEREECVKKEMARWVELMDRLVKHEEEARSKLTGIPCGVKDRNVEEFGLDCHDLSLENVFVDADDPTKITCIIDWESTTTRPLWQCAHLPAFLQASPFTAKLFRELVVKMAAGTSDDFVPPPPEETKLPAEYDFKLIAREWLYYELAGMKLRMAHRLVEWDGWEEGLAESMLGLEEFQEDWFKAGDAFDDAESVSVLSPTIESMGDIMTGLHDLSIEIGAHVNGNGNGVDSGDEVDDVSDKDESPERVHRTLPSGIVGPANGDNAIGHRKPNGVGTGTDILGASLARRKASTKIPVLAKEVEKENVLDTTGDICGGRGGELGRRLEAWLTVNGHESVPDPERSVDGPRRRWHNDSRDSD